jgi:hypothetical protein
MVMVTITDLETGEQQHEEWTINQADVNGRVRAAVGVFLSEHIGQHRYRTSDWIRSKHEPQSKQL